MNLILASQSPRRKELLSQLGYQFTCIPADIDESVLANESPEKYVERLAIEKALHVSSTQNNGSTVLGSDTSVVLGKEILGKPDNYQSCYNMLRSLSNRKHKVLTSIAVVKDNVVKSEVIETHVQFKALSDIEIENYWQTGEPKDKAGSYGIQGIGGQFIVAIEGSYSTVVGLPLYETAKLLGECGFTSPLQSKHSV